MWKAFFKKWQFPFKNKRPYIFPTRFAFGFAGLSILFLMIGFMYANNLLLLYLFFLVAMVLSAMGWTHRNFEFTQIISIKGEDFFAGEESSVILTVENTSRFKAFSFYLGFRETPDQKTSIPQIDSKARIDVVLTTVLPYRGLQTFPQLVLESRYPYGLFRCWKYFSFPHQIEVFPAKKGRHLGRDEKPLQSVSSREKSDFMGHRSWNSSDSFRKIDWKAKARTGELMVQIHHEPQPQELILSWEKSRFAGDIEARLSQMSQWIFDAAKAQEPFKVHIEGLWESDWGRGSSHLKTCMSQLNLLFPLAESQRNRL